MPSWVLFVIPPGPRLWWDAEPRDRDCAVEVLVVVIVGDLLLDVLVLSGGGARATRGVSSSRLALSATLSSLPRPRCAPPRTFFQEVLRHATAPTSLRGRNRACNFNCNRRHQMLIEVSIRFQDSSSTPLSRVFEPWILRGLPCRATAPLLLPSSACLSGCLIVAGELVFSSPLWLCNDLCAAGSA